MLVRVLFVEDVETDAELAMRRLRTDGLQCTYERVETEQVYLEALRTADYDIILSDFSLPQFDGMSALTLAMRELPDVPFIFLSGTIGEERAIEALRCGAVDYVLNGNLKRLTPAVTRALREGEQRNERTAQQLRIARLTRILEMLSGINTAVVRIRERLELLQEACRIAVTTGHYVTALVSFIEPGTRNARPCTWAGKGGERMSSLVFPIAATEQEDSNATGRVLRTGAVDGTAIGALTLTAQDRDAITDEELNLLGEVAANLSFALQYFEKESAVQFLSYFDPLTALAKRVLFCERLANRLTARKVEDPQPAVAIVDIEHLSIINDSYGRHAGDHLLRMIADRLRARFNTECLAYCGAGCFAMLLENADGQDNALRELQRHILAIFEQPFRIEAHDLPVTVKSGLACRGPGSPDAEALVQNAEAGLRQAKAAGEQYHHHRLDLSSKLAARLALEHRLRGALQQAAAECQRWKSAGLRPVHVAVNCSPLQLRRPGFAELVQDIVAGWTGNGYSSLSRLSDLPIDTLKIDRSFINGLPGDRASSRLVPTVISLARPFDLITVAEGVETRAQLNFLERAGCMQSQGFLHAQPMPAAALEALLAPKH